MFTVMASGYRTWSEAEDLSLSVAETPPAPRKNNSALMAKFEGRAPGGKALSYNKKGKLMSVNELVELSGY